MNTKKQEQQMKPKIFDKTSKIRLIAPAGPINKEQLEQAESKLESMGFRSHFSERVLYQHPYLAGSDADRLRDLHEAFEDSESDAIICIRGGYGTARLLDKIDFSLIKRNPKIFIGYSDITALLNSFWQKTGLVCFHGVLGTSTFTDYTRKQFVNLFENNVDEIFTYDKNSINVLREGKARGKLAGGNLAIVNSLIGTDYQVDFTNKIAFFEDIAEDFYKIDRMLTQLLLAGSLQKATAIILGTFTDCKHQPKHIVSDIPISLDEIFAEKFKDLKIPIISGFSFGHFDNKAIFPLGIDVEIDTNSAYKIKLLEKIFDN